VAFLPPCATAERLVAIDDEHLEVGSPGDPQKSLLIDNGVAYLAKNRRAAHSSGSPAFRRPSYITSGSSISRATPLDGELKIFLTSLRDGSFGLRLPAGEGRRRLLVRTR
jgi:hypothetical protein